MAQNAPKIQRIWPNFPCRFDHNFLANAVINLIFGQEIYNFPNLSIDIFVDHILSHKWACHNGHYGRMAIMATMAPSYTAIIMADMGVY